MNIDDLTYGELKKIAGLLNETGSTNHPFVIGKKYLIRTVTHIDIGELTFVGGKELVLVNASWVADTGRYHNAIKDGILNEVEPYPEDQPVIIGRGSLIDATEWLHALPRDQK